MGGSAVFESYKGMIIKQQSGLGIYVGIYCQQMQQTVVCVHAAVLCWK